MPTVAHLFSTPQAPCALGAEGSWARGVDRRRVLLSPRSASRHELPPQSPGRYQQHQHPGKYASPWTGVHCPPSMPWTRTHTTAPSHQNTTRCGPGRRDTGAGSIMS